MSLPSDLVEKYGLAESDSIVVEDKGDSIVLRSVKQMAAHVQALSRELLANHPEASVDDFLADRAKATWTE